MTAVARAHGAAPAGAGRWFALPLIEAATPAANRSSRAMFHPIAERCSSVRRCLRIGGRRRRGPDGRDRAATRQGGLLDRRGPRDRARRLQQVRDDDRRRGARARRPARLLRRRRAAEHRGQPRQADGRARPRARLRGRRVRRPAGAAAAEHRRPDDRHRRDGRRRACSSCSATTCRAASSTSASSGAAQIDRFGNINTTVIGRTTTRRRACPGRGGACEIAINARQVFVIMRQSRAASSRRSTSGRRPATSAAPSRPSGSGARAAGSAAARRVVVTDLGIYHFDETGEMRLDSLHPGATVEAVARHDRLGRRGRRRRSPRRRRRPPTSCG